MTTYLIALSAQTDTNIIEDLNQNRPAQNTDIVSEQQNEVTHFKIVYFIYEYHML